MSILFVDGSDRSAREDNLGVDESNLAANLLKGGVTYANDPALMSGGDLSEFEDKGPIVHASDMSVMHVDPYAVDDFEEDELPIGGDLAHTWTMAKELLGKLPPPRKDYAPNVKQYLNKVSEDEIISIMICRAPINSLLRGAVDVLSLGAIPPDTLYHLWMELDIHTDEGIKPYKLEKNHIIEFGPLSSSKSDAEKMGVIMQDKILVGDLLDNTEKLMGDKYFPYDAFNNNCQDFILSVLKANDLLKYNPLAETFIKQTLPLKDPRMSFASGIAKHVTDTAASLDRLIHGGSISKKDIEDTLRTFSRSSSVSSVSSEVGGAVFADKIMDVEPIA